MSWNEHFSEQAYQDYWHLSDDDRQRHLADPTTPDSLKALLLYQASQHQRDRQEWVAALNSVEEALALQPFWAEVWQARAALLVQMGDWAAAIAASDRALELQPTHAPTWRDRAVALARLHRWQEAVESCDRAIGFDPHDPVTWRTQSEAFSQLGRYQSALESYDQTLQLQPDDRATWGNRGMALQKVGRYEDAIASYDRLLEVEPEQPQVWYQRGLALRHLGRWEGAIANFDRALELQPDFYAATRSKLFSLLTSGQMIPYWLGQRSLSERDRLRNDLRNVFEAFVKTKLPALVVIALVVLSSTHDRGLALTVAAIFLAIAWISEGMAEAKR